MGLLTGRWPIRWGFTEFYGHYNGAIDYFTHTRQGEVDPTGIATSSRKASRDTRRIS
jgi:hypothetical protein